MSRFSPGPIVQPIPASSFLSHFPGNHNFSGANRAAGSLCPGFDAGLPLMAPITAPPDLPIGTTHHLTRPQFTVSFRMPLGSYHRKYCFQIILPDNHDSSAAYGTFPTVNPGIDYRSPLVPLAASPPDRTLAPRQNILRAKIAIPYGMPLGGQMGMQ